MDELEFYEQSIKDIAESRKLDLLDAAEYLKEALLSEQEKMMKLVSIRKQYLSPQDGGLVHFIGNYFPQYKEDELITLTTMTVEISKASCVYHQIKSFEKYHPTQPLFQEHPELYEKLRKKSSGNSDLELIRLDAVKYKPFPNMPKYRTCKYKDSYLFLDSYLNAMVPFYLIQKYGTENLYIRLDPYHISKTLPPLILEEEFIQPPNPHWIERLLIHPNQHEGTELFLPQYSIEDIAGDEWKRQQWWEYQTKGIRKLQIVANMKSEGETRHFSMSLEELSEEAIGDGMLIGRMIHLDAIDSYDTPFDQVKLKHLDLAVNIYMKSSIQERLNSTLTTGKRITDATFRTHLIRADNIMLSDLLEIAQTFFRSKTMVKEWIDSQFKFSEEGNV
ncbi:hypothetical protein [Paenibacillus sp. FSL R7-0337]|uniref:hypothetical protein n=1 Tax=Paenibacillus sp. FSL R7-0337 TaxID=1926588 RepID=UPI00096FBC57|nr:hypothetical protein [Paenibacillus sp. FSL R7-0337]OMF88729.1 hypothetical protein BK147_26340 [Paenibacillus sp. FSL R7-0337]